MSTDKNLVHIIDDDDAVRDSLALLLTSVGLESQQYASATEFLESTLDDRVPGCLILDVRMPGMSGLQLFKELHKRGLSWPVIFMTGHGDVPMAVQAMREGAFDFVQKPFRESELLDRVQQAIAQDRNDRTQDSELAAVQQRLAELTGRERDVLDRIVAGQANKVIAIELDISQRTVEQHRARVMRKMNARSLAHLIRMVIHAPQTSDNPS
nr:response regulator transcription factor [Oceanococcus sp. HetDA_MAG_MS8]